MAKKRTMKDQQGWKGAEDTAAPRVTTFPSNGTPPSESMAIAPATAPAAPAAGVDPAQALADIADLNLKVTRAHEAFQEAQKTAKDKRDAWNNLSEQLQRLIRRLTVPAPLPLFDQAQAEADLRRMVDADALAGLGAVSEAPEGESATAPDNAQTAPAEGEEQVF